MKLNKRLSFYILVAILLAGFLVRLYSFTSPLADWHSWRQTDTSAVSRNFVTQGYDILHPRYDDISNVQTGVDNPEGYRFVEFPIYNVLQAGLYQLFGIFTLEQWGRLVTIFSSVLSGLFLYLLVSRHSNKQLGLLTTFFYMFIPYNIFYGRTVLPDTTMVTAALGGIYFFDLWSSESTKTVKKRVVYYLLSILFTASALLLKPFAIFFVVPVLALAYQRWGIRLLAQWPLYIFAVVVVAPVLGWRMWMMQYPEGIPANVWLFNGNGIRFRPSFFRWIFYERLTKLITGYLGVALFAYGVFRLWALKEKWFFTSFLVSSLLYLIIVATGNVQHDYYQILIMPSVAILCAIGSYYLYSWSFRKLPFGKILLVVSVFSLFWFGWQQVKDYFNINNPAIIKAGEAVDRLTPKDAKVIAYLFGDTTLLYHTQRKGWPHFQADVSELVKKGASYMVLVHPTDEDLRRGEAYKVIEKTDEYIIFDLHQKP